MENATARTLEERLAQLEALLPHALKRPRLAGTTWALSFGVMAAATGLSVQGLGFPNHVYQVVLGVLTVALLYHRRWLMAPLRVHEWAIAPLNALAVSILYKLIIGSGDRQPFFWLKYPTLAWSDNKDHWLNVVPGITLLWEPSSLAQWAVDFTKLQTFLLLLTLVGGLFRLQPFIAYSALLLVLTSVPALVSFDWHWVFPALITCCVGLYIQSSDAHTA